MVEVGVDVLVVLEVDVVVAVVVVVVGLEVVVVGVYGQVAGVCMGDVVRVQVVEEVER